MSKGTPLTSAKQDILIQFLFFIYGFLLTLLNKDDLFIINVVSIDKYLILS